MLQAAFPSPLGPFYLWLRGDKLIYATFNKEWGVKFSKKHFPKEQAEEGTLPPELERQLQAYFQGRKLEFNWPIQLIGTEFQRQVWREIQAVPHGQVTTYKRIAERIQTRAYRAVGQAVGANPVSIIVPCHRVLGTHSLGGYSAGLNIKRLLLELENVNLAPNLLA